ISISIREHVHVWQPSRENDGMNERLARQLIRRLWKEAWSQAVGAAEEIGLLEKEYAESGGRALGLFRRGRVVPEDVTAEHVAAMLRRHRRRLLGKYSNPVLADIGVPVETDETQETAARVGDGDPDGKTLEAEIKLRGVVD